MDVFVRATPAILARHALEPERALELLEAFRPFAKDERGKLRLLYLEGRLRERSGNLREAIQKFEEILARSSSHLELITRLAKCFRAIGDARRAIRSPPTPRV